MNGLSTLKDIMDPKRLLSPDKYGNLELKERDSNATLTKIEIRGISSDTYALKFDDAILARFLVKKCPPRKCCDYIVVACLDTRPCLLFIEMKSSDNYESEEVIAQLTGAECAIDYCDSILNRFYGLSECFKLAEKRFFLFYKSPTIQKRQTRPTPKSYIPNTARTFHRFPIGTESETKVMARVLMSSK